jgi:predicted nucleic acid-binding protein
VRFWDSSAIVPLLTGEAASASALALLVADSILLVWWGTETECVSAIARLERSGQLAEPEAAQALERLAGYAASWQEVQPAPLVRRTASRMLRVHPLRAGDALQLAAAVAVTDGNPSTLPFVTSDARLAGAARREGFPVLQPGMPGD